MRIPFGYALAGAALALSAACKDSTGATSGGLELVAGSSCSGGRVTVVIDGRSRGQHAFTPGRRVGRWELPPGEHRVSASYEYGYWEELAFGVYPGQTATVILQC